MKKLKIAFVVYTKKERLKNYHSALYHVYQTLENLGHEVVVIDNLESLFQKLFKVKSLYYKIIKKKNYIRLMDKPVTKSIGRIARKKLEKYSNIDLIVSTGTMDVSYLKTNIPMLVWTDTPFRGLIDLYKAYSDMDKKFTENCIKYDYLAHQKCNFIVYPSAWAIDLAKKEYKNVKEKLQLIRFGSTLNFKLEDNEINQIVDNRLQSNLKIFFSAHEWERKGGDKITQIIRVIKSKNIDFELHIAGVTPNIPDDIKDNVICHGFLKKSDPVQFKQFIELYKTSHFLLLPTLSETFGLVFADASSMGLPSIASNVGGVTSAVESGINGFTLPLNSTAEQYAEKILSLYNNKELYKNLCLSTFDFYKDNLNWDKAGEKLQVLFESMVKYKLTEPVI